MTRCEPFTFTDDEGNEHTARIQVTGTLSAEDREHLAVIARAALQKIAAEPDCPNDPPCQHKASFHRGGRCVVRYPEPCGCAVRALASTTEQGSNDA